MTDLAPIIDKWEAYLERARLERAALIRRQKHEKKQRIKREAYKGPSPLSQRVREAVVARRRNPGMFLRERFDEHQERRRQADIASNILRYEDDAYRNGMA